MQALPKVSVIVPAYNGADLIGETIQSVLDQTYPHWELLIVDDRSPDQTAEVVRQFKDARIKYILHEENRGPDLARLTGLRASVGEIIAFLDQDDLFHPEKLERHVAYLAKHPEIGFTYNARFALNHSAKSVRELWRPPQTITLPDLVLAFPFAPSDMVMRRAWACREDIWEIDTQGSEIVFLGRLFLAGCRFGFVEQALNYRRYHGERTMRNLTGKCADELRCQEIIFTDPRCPAEVRALRTVGNVNLYVVWAYHAFVQGETETGKALLNKALALKPDLLAGVPCELVRTLASYAMSNESRDYEQLVQSIAAQLPATVGKLAEQWQGVIKQGYLLKGARAIVWGRNEDGGRFFKRANELGAKPDKLFMDQLVYELINYEAEFGSEAAHQILDKIAKQLERTFTPTGARELKGCFSINQAFRHYHAQEYQKVPGNVFRALFNEPRYLTNRGLLSVLFQSVVRKKVQQAAAL